MSYSKALNSDEFEASPLLSGRLSEATGLLILAKLTAMYDNDSLAVPELPPIPLSKTKRLTRVRVDNSTAGAAPFVTTAVVLVAGTALMTVRPYRGTIYVGGATKFEFLDSDGNNLKTFRFNGPTNEPFKLPLDGEPWCIPPTAKGLSFKSSAAVLVEVDLEYLKNDPTA